jgi:tetratricopeptide (TPR) repeat protein
LGSLWGVFWVDCGSKESIRADFKTISTQCGWPLDNENELFGAKHRLASCGRPLLLILDNCDDAKENYNHFIPSGLHATVLMTTRLLDAKKYASLDTRRTDEHFVHMKGLDEEASISLLLKVSSNSNDDEKLRSQASGIVSILDHHPLAIIVAGSLVWNAIYSLTDLLETLQRRFMQRELLNTVAEQTKYKKIAATFEVSAQYLMHSAESDEVAVDALELLDVLGFLRSRDVSEDIFIRAWQEAERVTCRPKSEDDSGIDHLSSWHVTKCQMFLRHRSPSERNLAFRKARAYLARLSLINLGGVNNAISCHALVHSWARERDPRLHERPLVSASILALSAAGSQTWESYTPALAQQCEAGFTLQLQELDGASSSPGSQMEKCRIWYVYGTQMLLANSVQTVEFCRWLVTMTKEVINAGTSELHVIDAEYLLAVACRSNGEVEEGLSSLDHVVKVKAALPTDNQSRLASQHELACAYEALGRSREAVSLLEEVVKVQEEVAEDDWMRLTCEHSLGGAYKANGQLDKAVPLLEHVVKVHKRLPKDHPSRLASQFALAGAYQANEQADRAVSLLEEVVQMRETLPENHPSLLKSQHALADAYQANGQVERAVSLLEHVIRLKQACLPPGHRNRIDSEQLLESLNGASRQSARNDLLAPLSSQQRSDTSGRRNHSTPSRIPRITKKPQRKK